MNLILSKDEQLNLWDFSVKLSKSEMVPVIFRNKPDNVFATILYGKELGLNPIISLNAISVIQGQVTLKTQTMNGVVLANHPNAIIDIKQDEAKKEVCVTVKRNKDDAPYVAIWNMEKAKQMGLTGKDNYIRQPLTMLRARALSEALRVKFADTLLGFMGTEEMEDLPPIRDDNAGKLLTAIQDSMEQDFPIPPEDKIYGNTYRFQNGKFRGLTFGECDMIEFEEYLNDLKLRKTNKSWEKELIAAMEDYMANYSTYLQLKGENNE